MENLTPILLYRIGIVINLCQHGFKLFKPVATVFTIKPITRFSILKEYHCLRLLHKTIEPIAKLAFCGNSEDRIQNSE